MIETIAYEVLDYCVSNNLSLDHPFLIIDLDHMTAGMVRCQSDYTIHCEKQTKLQGSADFFEQILRGYGVTTLDIRQRWYEGQNGYNKMLKSYIRSHKNRDMVVFDQLSASQLDSYYQNSAHLLAKLLEQVDHFKAIDDDQLKIILAGSMANVYYAEYDVRAHFSVSPFLSDARFMSLGTINPAQYATLGDEVKKAHSDPIFNHDVSVAYYRLINQQLSPVMSQTLASKGTKLSELGQEENKVSMLLEREATLMIRIDQKNYQLPLKSYLSAEMGHYTLSLANTNNVIGFVLEHNDSNQSSPVVIPFNNVFQGGK